jgi:hypothetical protein
MLLRIPLLHHAVGHNQLLPALYKELKVVPWGL